MLVSNGAVFPFKCVTQAEVFKVNHPQGAHRYFRQGPRRQDRILLFNPSPTTVHI